MRIFYKQTLKRACLLVCLMLLASQLAVSQNLFCERMGDNRLITWIGTETSTASNNNFIKVDEFMFHNLSKHPVSFYYNGINIHLQAGALSQAFKKPLPTSFTDCRILIDGIPLQTYYNHTDFVEQDYENLPVSRKFVDNKTVEELKNDINVFTKTLARVESIQSTMPAWFSKAKNIDFRIKQVNDWLKTHNDWLSKKTAEAALANSPANTTTGSSSSASAPALNNTPATASTSSNTSSSAGGNANAMTETQRKEMEFKRQMAALEQQQREKQEQAAALSEGLQGVAGMFAQGIAEDRARAEAREERNSLIREKNALAGSILLNQYKAEADKGNELAIGKVIEAYYLMGDATSQKSFMHTMINKYNSPLATATLTNYYTSVMNNYKSAGNRHMRRGIFKLVFYSGIGVGLAYLGSEIDIYDEPDRATEADVLTYSGGGMMIVGVLAGLSSMAKSGYKYKPEYIEAQQGLQGLQQRVKVSFAPKVNLNNSYGMALKMTF